jgi:membrane-bound lytic murein transglycosylase B
MPRALPIWIATLALTAAPSAGARDFDAWLEELRSEARQQGVSEATLSATLGELEPREDILEQDRSQPRKPKQFCEYMEKRLTSTRIARGQKMLREEKALLREINQAYGVPPRYLVALWGLETNFGDYQGDFPAIVSLATLAYDPRRGDLFRKQVLAALQMIDQGHAEPDFQGSWAGATGQVQFMPTTFLAYAVDHDGDGRKNLWSSVPDALASAANYLSQSGWRSGEAWGRQVQLGPDLTENPSALKRRRGLDEWRALGVSAIDGSTLPSSNLRGSIVLPRRRGLPAFLTYRNYRTFLAWNNSTFFAVSVGTLADELTGRGALDICGIRRGVEIRAAPEVPTSPGETGDAG